MGAGGTQEPFEIKTGYHVFKPAVTVVLPQAGIKGVVSRRQHDGPDFYLNLFCLLMQVNGIVLTGSQANAALFISAARLSNDRLDLCRDRSGSGATAS